MPHLRRYLLIINNRAVGLCTNQTKVWQALTQIFDENALHCVKQPKGEKIPHGKSLPCDKYEFQQLKKHVMNKRLLEDEFCAILTSEDIQCPNISDTGSSTIVASIGVQQMDPNHVEYKVLADGKEITKYLNL